MKDFVAIDFESANDQHGSICSVGIVIVKNGEAAKYAGVSEIKRTLAL